MAWRTMGAGTKGHAWHLFWSCGPDADEFQQQPGCRGVLIQHDVVHPCAH